MQWLPGQEHHVVGDVDDVVDRTLPGCRQPCLQPGGGLADGEVLEHAGGEARAQLRTLHGHPGGRELACGTGVIRPRRRRERRSRSGVQLPCDAVDAEAVGAIRCDLELEHVLGDRERFGERRPGRELGIERVEDEDALSPGTDLQLGLGEDHALGDDPAESRGLEPPSVRHDSPRQRDRHGLTRRHVGSAAYDRRRTVGRRRAEIDAADLQPVGVGVLLSLEHASHHEPVGPLDAVPVDRLDLRPGHGETLLDRLDVEPGIAVFEQPGQRHLHGSCSRKRRSFSKYRRRSGMPCLSIAIRSMPIPHAKPWTFSGS